MDKPPRNPVWSSDELTLTLDLYVKTEGSPIAKDDAVSEGLSGILDQIHGLDGADASDTVKNLNNVCCWLGADGKSTIGQSQQTRRMVK